MVNHQWWEEDLEQRTAEAAVGGISAEANDYVENNLLREVVLKPNQQGKASTFGKGEAPGMMPPMMGGPMGKVGGAPSSGTALPGTSGLAPGPTAGGLSGISGSVARPVSGVSPGGVAAGGAASGAGSGGVAGGAPGVAGSPSGPAPGGAGAAPGGFNPGSAVASAGSAGAIAGNAGGFESGSSGVMAAGVAAPDGLAATASACAGITEHDQVDRNYPNLPPGSDSSHCQPGSGPDPDPGGTSPDDGYTVDPNRLRAVSKRWAEMSVEADKLSTESATAKSNFALLQSANTSHSELTGKASTWTAGASSEFQGLNRKLSSVAQSYDSAEYEGTTQAEKVI